MAEQTRSELEQAAQIVGTIKQFLTVVESRTATLINEQKVENALASESGVKLRGQMTAIAADAKAVRDALTQFLQHDLQTMVVGHIQTAAAEAGKRQAAAFGYEVAGQITTGIKTNLEGATKHATAAAIALNSVAWRYTWRGALMATGIATGVSLGIILAAAGALYAYAPSKSEITARRAERDEIQATIDDLNKRGGKMKHLKCGPQSRLCVLVDPAAGSFYIDEDKENTYMIVKGY